VKNVKRVRLPLYQQGRMASPVVLKTGAWIVNPLTGYGFIDKKEIKIMRIRERYRNKKNEY
jgi:hypothetical protein